MRQAAPQMRGVAERLIAHETSDNKASEPKVPAAFQVVERLRSPLATLMGKAGFRVLVSRALGLAGKEVPWLRTVHVKADGALEGWEELQPQLDPEEWRAGGLALIAQLLGLLVALIGENLTLQLVREVWPKLPLDVF